MSFLDDYLAEQRQRQQAYLNQQLGDFPIVGGLLRRVAPGVAAAPLPASAAPFTGAPIGELFHQGDVAAQLLAGGGALAAAHLPAGLTGQDPVSAGAVRGAAVGAPDPLTAAMAVETLLRRTNPALATAGEMALNPLNYLPGAAEETLGRVGLRGTADVVRGLNEAQGLPLRALGTGARAGVGAVRGLLGPGAQAAERAVPEVEQVASRLAADVPPPPPTIAAPPRAPFTAETARDMLLDQLGGAPMPAKARLLGALNEANFGGGAGNAMRAVTGGADLGALGDLERPYTNYLLQRTIENPNAITALRDLHPGLHAAVDLLPDLPERTALDLQNEVRRAAGLPEKVVKPPKRTATAAAVEPTPAPAPEPVHPELLNADGTPKTLYHGTSAAFGDFKMQPGAFGTGAYFTDSPFMSTIYALGEEGGTRSLDGVLRGAEPAPNIRPAHLALKNPFLWPDDPAAEAALQALGPDALTARLRAQGYDGVVVKNPVNPHYTEYVAFDPGQIESPYATPATQAPATPATPSLTEAQAAFDAAATPEARLAAERQFVDAYQGAGLAAPSEQVAREGAAAGNRGQDLFAQMRQEAPARRVPTPQEMAAGTARPEDMDYTLDELSSVVPQGETLAQALRREAGVVGQDIAGLERKRKPTAADRAELERLRPLRDSRLRLAEHAEQRTAPSGGDVAAGGMGGQAPIQLATTLGGAAAGGIAGYEAAGDQASPTDRAAATLAGAAAGGTAGRFAPELVPVAEHIAQTVAKSAENTLLDPDVLKLGLSEGWKAFRAQQGAPGVRMVDMPAALGKAWRAQVVTTVHNLAQDALDRLAIVREFGRDYGVTMADVKAKVGDLRANWGREGNARYGQSATDLLGSLGKEDYDLTGKLGTSQISETLQQAPGQALSAPQRVLAGAGFGLGNLKMNAIPGLAPVWGAARGYAAPFIDRTFAVLNGLQHDAPRLAMFEGIVGRDLPVVAEDFLGRLRAGGADTAALDGLRGRFDPAAVEAVAGKDAAAAWDALSTRVLDAAGDRTAHLFGDFRKTNPALRALSAVSPFSSWGVKRLPVVAELGLRHPGAALLAARGLQASGEETKRQGLAPYYAGTLPISTETPVLGALARARLGGAAGTVHLNPLGVISPFGADALAPQPEDLATTSAYQKATQGMARVGLGVNPAIQALAYVAGQDTRPPSSLSRTAGLEYALPGPVIPSGKVALDLARGAVAPTVQQALTGLNLGGAQTSTGPAPDPLRRAMADLYHEDTGGVWGDRGSAPYLVQSLNPQSPLYRRALARVKGQEATGDVVSNVAPFGGSVSTAGQEQAGAARMALPISPAELSRYRQESPTLYALAQRRNDQAQLEDPALRVADQYASTTPTETKLALLRLWDVQHSGLLADRRIFEARRAQYMAGIGLAPSARTAFDVRELAPNPLTAPAGQPGGGIVPAPAPPRGQPAIPTGPLVPAR